MELLAGTVLSWVRAYLPKISFRLDFEVVLDGLCCYFGCLFGCNVVFLDAMWLQKVIDSLTVGTT